MQNIDLRQELKNLLETEFGGIAKWIAIRHFSTTHSEYWNEVTKEAIGGPAYTYTDTLVECYSLTAVKRILPQIGSVVEEFGQLEQIYDKYYLMSDVDVKENDEILDLDYFGKTKPTLVYTKAEENTVLLKYSPKNRYKIKKVDPKIGDFGRIEYIIALVYKSVTR